MAIAVDFDSQEHATPFHHDRSIGAEGRLDSATKLQIAHVLIGLVPLPGKGGLLFLGNSHDCVPLV